jgi:hypothetical protein
MGNKRHIIGRGVMLGIAAWIVTYLIVACIFVLPPVGSVYIGQSLECCGACLRQVEMAKGLLETENKWEVGHPVLASDLQTVYGYVPKCPGGGKYTFNRIGVPATCSLAGTAGPQPRKKVVAVIFWRWDPPPSAPHEL